MKKMVFKASDFYEERRLGSHSAVCDVCDKPVGLGSYMYLCSSCRDKLPEHFREGHHCLNDYPEIRKALLKDAIKRNR